ncbi:MAG TPA: hypothetical protein VGO89_17590, partial [Streptomyces sp.]|nr:hypothetical protein [Streptomyces sp.]
GYGGIGDLPGYGQQQSPYGNGVADGFETSGFGADGYGTNGYGNGYGTDGYGTDAYGNAYGTDGYGAGYGMGGTYAGEQGSFPQAPTGGGGVWVPQQRDPYEQLQPEQQPYPYQNGDPNGYGAPGNGYYY